MESKIWSWFFHRTRAAKLHTQETCIIGAALNFPPHRKTLSCTFESPQVENTENVGTGFAHLLSEALPRRSNYNRAYYNTFSIPYRLICSGGCKDNIEKMIIAFLNLHSATIKVLKLNTSKISCVQNVKCLQGWEILTNFKVRWKVTLYIDILRL